MAVISINYPFWTRNQNEANTLKQSFEDALQKSILWELFGLKVPMKLDISVKERVDTDMKTRINSLTTYTQLFPNDEYARKELELQKKRQNHYMDFYTTINLTGEIDATISIHKNTIQFNDPTYFQTLLGDDSTIGVDNTEMIDDEFYNQIREYSRAFYYAILLSNTRTWNNAIGKVEVLFDNIIYRTESFFERGYLYDLSKTNSSLFQAPQLSVFACYDWIVEHTSLCMKAERSPIYFTALTYLFNRDSFERMMFANIALENLYCDQDTRGKTSMLKKRIKAVFPTIDDQTINQIYKIRSKFVHGEQTFSIYDSFVEFDDDKETESLINLAEIVVIETIRLLISKNATELRFQEIVSYECI